jgi:hypothetical protein
MQATVLPAVKLTAVTTLTRSNGKTRYIGHFEDGSTRQIRESARAYAQVAQIAPCIYPPRADWDREHPYGEEFIFGAKRPTISKWLASRLITIVSVTQS